MVVCAQIFDGDVPNRGGDVVGSERHGVDGPLGVAEPERDVLRGCGVGVSCPLGAVGERHDAQQALARGRAERFGERVSEPRFRAGRRVGEYEFSVLDGYRIAPLSESDGVDVELFAQRTQLIAGGVEGSAHRFVPAFGIFAVPNRHTFRDVAEKRDARRKLFFYGRNERRPRKENREEKNGRHAQPELEPAPRARNALIVSRKEEQTCG